MQIATSFRAVELRKLLGGRTLRKLLAVVLVLVLALFLGRAWVIHYIAPREPLDLAYSDLSVAGKILDMVKQRKFEAELTQEDVNNIVKKALARHPDISPDVTVTGARFSLHGNRLTADMNLKYKGKLDVGATLFFVLDADGAVLTVTYAGAKLRSIDISPKWYSIPPIRVNLDEALPPPVAIQQVEFRENSVNIRLKLNGAPRF